VAVRRLLRIAWFVLVTVLAVSVFRFAPVSAGVSFQPPSPEELGMTSEPQAPGAPAIILFREVDRDDNGRTSHEDNYFRIKILTEEGRKYADIEIPFFKGSENIVNIKARTIRPDGSIVNFDGNVFDKSIVKSKGFRYLAKTFTLPDVQVGGIIEYSYTRDLQEYFIFDSHWILSADLFTKSAQFSLKPYTSPYQTWSVRWTWHNLPPGTPKPKEGSDHVIRLEAHNIPAFQLEDFMPPPDEAKARVDFTYSDEAYEPDPVKFWKRIGKRWNDRLEDFIGKRKAMERAVAQIVSPNDPPEVKLQKIYARVQQIRNTSYEVQKTQQEEKRAKEKEPNNVEDVWNRGYGTGVQLTWLYLALVRAAGFEAYGVWVSDRRDYFFSPQLMDSYKLNTNVVLVKLNGKDLYCDPGAAFTPFGLLTWSETGVPGLRLDKDGGDWVQTILPESAASRIERSANLKLSEMGDLAGKLTVTFTGLEALRRRVEERNDDEADRKKFLEDEVQQYIPAACDVQLLNKPDWSSSEPSLVAEFNLKIPGWVSGAGRRAFFPVGLFSATEKHLFDHANRIHPVYFQFPSERVDDITVELPPGWQVASLPRAQMQDGHVVIYTLDMERSNGALHLTRKLIVDVLLLEVKYYTVLRDFFQVVRTGDEEQIVLQPGAAAARN
jgi:hypothetical protein